MTLPAAVLRTLGTLSVATVLTAGMLAMDATPAAPLLGAQRASAAATATTVTVVPQNDGVVAPNGTLVVRATVTAGEALPASTVRLSIDPSTSATATDLAARLSSTTVDGYAIGSASTPAIGAGERKTVTITVQASSLSWLLGNSAGGYAVKAALWSDGARRAIGSTGISWMPSGFTKSVDLTTVVPLTAPSTTTGLVDAEQLAELTAPEGEWNRTLRAAEDSGATIALDPAIPASIRVLGTQAPADAVGFLAALTSADTERLRLPYADGDVTLQRAAGAATVLQPTSFLGSVSSSATAVPTPVQTAVPTTAPSSPVTNSTGAPTPSDGAPTPSPSGTPSIDTSTAAVTDANYSVSSVAWPATAASGDDLRFLKQSGYAATIVDASTVNDTAARRAAGPLATADGEGLLVTDQVIGGLFDDAANEEPGALAALTAALTADAAGGTVGSVLVTADRDADRVGALRRVLERIESHPWVHSGTVTSLLAAKHPASITVRKAASDPRADTASDLVDGEADVRSLGRAIAHPQTITGPARLALLGLLSNAWRGQSSWSSAVRAGVSRFSTIVQSVHVDRKSTVNYFGGSASIPVSIVNNLSQPITVVLRGSPSNGRLVVQGDATATIAAESSGLVKLPVRSISNGSIQLTLTLHTPDGWTIGEPRTADININAGWETVAAVVFITGLVGLFALGFYRNVVRRRRMIRKRAARAARG